jgi:protein-tyrosine phosphatase
VDEAALTASPSAVDVLLICTGNQCRSPMAAGLLRAYLQVRGNPLAVASAGFIAEGLPAPPEVRDTMWGLGLDVSEHRSRLLTPAMVAGAGLVLGMTRQHVIDAALLAPSSWEWCFTVADAVRRAEAAGPRQPLEQVQAWAQRLHAGRTRSSLFALPFSDDIPDPMGGRPRDYERTRDELAGLTARLAALLSPESGHQRGS